MAEDIARSRHVVKAMRAAIELPGAIFEIASAQRIFEGHRPLSSRRPAASEFFFYIKIAAARTRLKT